MIRAWVWLFCAGVFYLLPVVVLDKYIGAWAWPTGIAFWLLAAVIIGLAARYTGRKTK
jgi:hypothetical protein